MKSTFPFRVLVFVCAAFAILGICERCRRPVDVFRHPQFNFPEAMSELYPGTARTEYLLGRRAETLADANANSKELQQDPERMAEFLTQMQGRLANAAKHYENALNAGLKSEEDLTYNYALTLIRIRADGEKIDRAIADWRREFPHSSRRDLGERRKAIEKQYQQFQRVLQGFQRERQAEMYRQELEKLNNPSRPPNTLGP